MNLYVIQQGDAGPIKIGISRRPQDRIASLQTACPYPLKILKVVEGSKQLESALHNYLHAYRMKGEWFEPAPAVFTVIAELESLTPEVLHARPTLTRHSPEAEALHAEAEKRAWSAATQLNRTDWVHPFVLMQLQLASKEHPRLSGELATLMAHHRKQVSPPEAPKAETPAVDVPRLIAQAAALTGEKVSARWQQAFMDTIQARYEHGRLEERCRFLTERHEALKDAHEALRQEHEALKAELAIPLPECPQKDEKRLTWFPKWNRAVAV